MRVVIADDGALFREGIALLLADAGIEVVGQASTGDELLEILVDIDVPDAAILDVKMPPGPLGGMEVGRQLRSRYPQMALLFLSATASSHYLMRILEIDAARVGYRLKDMVTGVETLRSILERLLHGEVDIEPEIAKLLVSRARDGSERAVETLSGREREVLDLMAQGRSNKAIESFLSLTSGAVEKHISSIFVKLQLPPDSSTYDRRVKAVLTYLKVQRGLHT